MFKKPLAHQSNSTPLRSSARRQLVSDVFLQYPRLSPRGSSPSGNHAQTESLRIGRAAGDQAESGTQGEEEEGEELGKLLVPKGIKTGTFETSAGVRGTMYFSLSGDPLWLTTRTSGLLIPTLHLLSLLPATVFPFPIIQIYNPLPPPLLTGAPLFFAAVRNTSTPYLLPDLPQGALVALVTSSTPDNSPSSVRYVGVGTVVCDGGVKGALERRTERWQGGGDVEEGKFVDILSIIDDHLCLLGSKLNFKTFELPMPVKPLAPLPEITSVPAESEAGTPSNNVPPTDQVASLSIAESNSTTPSLTPSEISTLLSQALLQALSTQPPSFPIPASLFYSSHVLPNRPAYIPVARRDDVVIGKSEWKKLGKWMKELSKDGLIKIKESKGEIIIIGFDPTHRLLQDHVDFTTISQEETKEAKKIARQAAAADSTTKEMSIEELWKPSPISSSFWELCGVDKNQLHPPGLLKAALDKYVTKHNLIDTRDQRLIILDTELGRAVGFKSPSPGTTLSRDEVLRKLRTNITWSISIGGNIRKGGLNPIVINIKTRQGRKTVTLVSGLEGFGIDVEAFAEEMKRICAGSTSIQPLTGSSPKLGLKEVMIQGSQTKAVIEALISRGVPKKWIQEGK